MSRRAARLAVVAVIALLAAACVDQGAQSGGGGGDQGATGEWTPEFVDGRLQPLPDGFPNRPITIVSVDEPGSKDGIYARTWDKALEGISPVDIVVSDEPSAQGGTWGMLADVKTRNGGQEGYFPVIASVQGSVTDLHVEPIEEEQGVGLDDMNFFLTTETQPYLMIQRKNAPWGTGFKELIEYGKAHPGELRYISTGVGSGSDIAMEWILDGLGVEVQKIPTGGHEEAGAAVGSGDGDFTLARTDIGVSVEAGGRGDVIFATTEEAPEPWGSRPHVSSASDLAEMGLSADIIWAVITGMFLPKEVPELHVRWLHALFDAAAKTETYQSRKESLPGLVIDVTSIEESNKLKQDAYTFSEPIIRSIGLHKDG